MRFITRPLPPIWPTGNRTLVEDRRESRFKASWAATLELLERELRHLEAEDPVVIEAGYQPHEIRLDGLPRRGARPSDPAVILSFNSRVGPLRYGCDTYWDHEANLRAVALSLEALRAVDRYGVTKRGEQYRGFEALPPSGEGEMSRSEAEAFIRHHAGDADEPDLEAAYRTAAKKLHPDVKGGSHADFARLERARQAVRL